MRVCVRTEGCKRLLYTAVPSDCRAWTYYAPPRQQRLNEVFAADSSTRGKAYPTLSKPLSPLCRQFGPLLAVNEKA